MIDAEREKFGVALLETLTSLDRELVLAGGRAPSLAMLQSMSAFQFLCMIAPNKIRFKHINKGE